MRSCGTHLSNLALGIAQSKPTDQLETKSFSNLVEMEEDGGILVAPD
jgi:hypothetical protein